MSDFWKKCSSCKKEIGFNTEYYECSVSTCRGQRTGLVFCSLPCWELHTPTARHKNPAAITERSPSFKVYKESLQKSNPSSSTEPNPQRRIITKTHSTPQSKSPPSHYSESEILIVASKLKAYVKDRFGMNTSANVMHRLSTIVRRECDRAVKNAESDGRKTLMDRDF